MSTTTPQPKRLDPELWHKFLKVAKPYWFSEQKWKARGLLGLLLLLALAVNAINVGISFIFRNIDTSLATFPQTKDASIFWRFITLYAGLLVLGTPIVVMYGYIQDKLGLQWREWLTNHFLDKYFQNRAYYQINFNQKIDNPDQRIAEDIRSFTRTSLSFTLLILTSIITLISFTGVLLSISVSLSVALVIYAILGTVVTAGIGQRLIGINYNQLKREADFRYGLIHVRDNAESIAFYQGETEEILQLKQRFMRAILNFDLLINWQRNLGFFTTSYNYFVSALPYLVIAPIYFAGETDFGTFTQAAIAFSQIFSALSVVVGQFESLTAFAAGIERMGDLDEVLETADQQQPGMRTIDVTQASGIELRSVTLMTPNYERTLVRDLPFMLQPGEGLVIVGNSGSGKSSLLRAIAGLWNAGTGQIIRPSLSEMMFLPQRPYMVLGSLRSQLLYPNPDNDILESKMRHVLEEVNLAELPERVGGFDVELDWANVLSLGEQQRLAFARLLLSMPNYVILDEATSALDLANEKNLYQQLKAKETTLISVGHRPSLLQYHEYVLELDGSSNWRLLPMDEYTVDLNAFS
ncbi:MULTISPECIES: ABC transporter ATP-binding protein/permease [Cyanophyceae]|uniref:ABC transporter ATP-binding protein/permease n=1 Tax=Cyanophyceae TaxID=3028117 RepID=UPI00232C1ABE|nr:MULTISPECIES: ABC transporter ATP-binding protein/permease [Cyanophyceae]MDB9356003.1 ABC transporter ATP-binding protein/permease [Nodularia spumigena CS-587/03]MDB9338097.1 ABC transporter ATP-binding protein/permease [Nodularia spumigena CS-589/07]MDB9402006.1 ABC transporter ATP-binding protein/permease [Microcystis aeruginosa CS-567/02-A1]MDB9499102.1 ABC transporter ATP-binding protein/permease [Nodularia spumigena CS-336/02]MDB9531814.1 ABC transporter ATP-binding protein/permease [N